MKKQDAIISEKYSNLITSIWTPDILKMVKNDDEQAVIVISNDKEQAWLITDYPEYYDNAYASVDELIYQLLQDNNYNLKTVADILGITPKKLWLSKCSGEGLLVAPVDELV